jgi:hypothetical protein
MGEQEYAVYYKVAADATRNIIFFGIGTFAVLWINWPPLIWIAAIVFFILLLMSIRPIANSVRYALQFRSVRIDDPGNKYLYASTAVRIVETLIFVYLTYLLIKNAIRH